MAIDPYQACPCLSGKKLKFCCVKDLLPEMDDLLRMMDGEQFVAAADRCRRLRNRHGDRPALLAVEAEAYLYSDRFDELGQIAQLLQEKAPELPVGALMRTTWLAANDRATEAMEVLQDVFDGGWPPRSGPVLEAMRATGVALAAEGRMQAARRLLLLYSAAVDNGDEEIIALLGGLQKNPSTFVMLRSDVIPRSQPANPQNRARFEEALELVRDARWRAAAQRFAELAQSDPTEWAAAWNAGAMWLWAARDEEAAPWFQRAGEAEGAPEQDAVDALALALALTPHAGLAPRLRRRRVFEVRNADLLMERLLSSPRMGALPNPERLRLSAEDADGPPPKGVFAALDRPVVRRAADAPREAWPELLGMVWVFGRQTDREARVELVGRSPQPLEDADALLRQTAGDALGPQLEETTLAEAHPLLADISVSLFPPADAPPGQVDQWIREKRRQRLVETWLDVPLPLLDGQTVRQAAGQPSMRRRVLACLALFDHLAQSVEEEFPEDQVREALGLPPAPSERLADSEHVAHRPPHRLRRLAPESLDNEQLIEAVRIAQAMGVKPFLRRCAQEGLRRGDRFPPRTRIALLQALRETARSLEEEADTLGQLGDAARQAGLAVGVWLVEEAMMRLQAGQADKAGELLRRAATQYGHEPETQRVLTELARQFRPQQRAAAGGAGEPEGAAPPEKKLWTPDSGAPPATPPGAQPPETPGEKPTLWTPDS